MDAKKIGNYLRTKRQQKNLTQLELAHILGVTHQAVSRWETGESIPDVIILERLSVFYGVSIDNIIKQDEAILDQKNNSNNDSDLSLLFALSGVAYLATVFISYFSFMEINIWLWIMIVLVLTTLSSLVFVIPYNRNKTSQKYFDSMFRYIIDGAFISIGIIAITSFYQLNNFLLEDYTSYLYFVYPGSLTLILLMDKVARHNILTKSSRNKISLMEFINSDLQQQKFINYLFILSLVLFIGSLIFYYPLTKVSDDSWLFYFLPIFSLVLASISVVFKLKLINNIIFVGIIINAFIYIYTFKFMDIYPYGYLETLRKDLLPLNIISAIAGVIPTLISLVYIVVMKIKKESIVLFTILLMIYNFTFFNFRGFTQTYIDETYGVNGWENTVFLVNFSESESILATVVTISICLLTIVILEKKQKFIRIMGN